VHNKFFYGTLSQVRVIDQHEDSIYSVAWSPADAWMYCSLSYDGTYVKLLQLVRMNYIVYTTKLINRGSRIDRLTCLIFADLIRRFHDVFINKTINSCCYFFHRVILNHVPSTEKYKILL
jgi:WD40 repeat protein